MTKSYVDWNCRLLSDIHESIIDPQDTLTAITYLHSKYSIDTFWMMPNFISSFESVSEFLLRRNKALSNLIAISNNNFDMSSSRSVKILPSASVLLEKDVHSVLNIKKLTIPFERYRYLPIKLPLCPHDDWIDLEINRILYRSNLKILFLSFETACLLYPMDVIEKLIRISHAIFQFNYRSLSNSKIRGIISMLLQQNSMVVFGTSLNSAYKIYQYELDYYVECLKSTFSESEISSLLQHTRMLPRKQLKIYY